MLRISADFFAGDDKVLTSESQSFQWWQLRADAGGESELNWRTDREAAEYSAFLHPRLGLDTPPGPVIEVRWAPNRLDEVALRLADTPANDRVTRWRLRLLGGTDHLWRQLQIGDRTIDADDTVARAANLLADGTTTIDLDSSGTADTILRWRTNETLPLQIVERIKQPYAGLGLYEGLPLTSGMQIPAALQPAVRARILTKDPITPGNTFPGGPVFEEIKVDLNAGHDWIWLQAKPMEQPPAAQ